MIFGLDSLEIFREIELGNDIGVHFYVSKNKRNNVDLNTIRDTGSDHHSLLTAAAMCGQHAIMVYLIEQGGIKPYELGNIPLIMAASKGQAATVSKLLTYPEVAKFADIGDNIALKGAIASTDIDTVKALLQNPAVLKNLEKNGAIVIPWASGSLDLLKEIISHPVFQPHLKEGLHKALVMAAMFGFTPMVSFLLEKSIVRKTVADNNNEALRAAWNKDPVSNHECISQLLQFRSVRMFELNNPHADPALREIVKSIENQQKVKFVFPYKFAIGCALAIGLMSIWLSAGLIALIALGAQAIRVKIQSNAYQTYVNKSQNELQALNPKQREAFKQGVKSSKSVIEQIRSSIPVLTPAANLHWNAYYAGKAAGQLKDDVVIRVVKSLR